MTTTPTLERPPVIPAAPPAATAQTHPRTTTQTQPSPPQPRRILVCLSLSDRSAAIAAEAWRLATVMGAHCQFLHVGTDTPEAADQLRQAMSSAGVPDDAPLIMRRGHPHLVVGRVAREQGIDLIIAGILDRHTTFKRHIRSTAGRIACAAPCSVLLLTHPRVETRPLERFVVSVDFDDLSRAMLKDVLAWGRREGAKDWHVVDEYDPQGFYSLLDGEGETRSARTRRLTEFVQPYDWTGLRLNRLCLVNKRGCDAIWYAQMVRADLLALPMSEHRQGFWKRLLQFRLDVDVHALPCAVLLYRQPAPADSHEDKP